MNFSDGRTIAGLVMVISALSLIVLQRYSNRIKYSVPAMYCYLLYGLYNATLEFQSTLPSAVRATLAWASLVVAIASFLFVALGFRKTFRTGAPQR